MKHVKLFESYSRNLRFSSEDVSRPGEVVYCWNFEDGWMVALAGRSDANDLHEFLLRSQENLVTREIEHSRNPGIAFVTTGKPYDLSVGFTGSDFDPSEFSILVSSKGAVENLEGDYNLSCCFALKRGQVIFYRWNGGDVTVTPIQDYLEYNRYDDLDDYEEEYER